MKIWAGVTDNDWYDFLSRSGADEVNFWQPSGRAPFVGLTPGAPFLFKLKRPFNHIAGGGYFVRFSVLPISIAWEAFDVKNGAPSKQTLENMIRRLAPGQREIDPLIGCTVLTEPFFWPKELWIEDPIGWTGNIVRGRYYDTADIAGRSLWKLVQERLGGINTARHEHQVQETNLRYGQPAVIMPRLGQGAFRVVVTDAYNRRCALTGEKTLPVLEAAHIRPFSENGPNDVSNGLLMRSDFHKLFDAGYVTVTPDLNIEVSSRIKEEWFNGKAYYRLHGQPLSSLPDNPSCFPSESYLRWHNENRFHN